MIRRRILWLALAAAWLPAAARAQDAAPADLVNPDRPGIADGSKVVGAGRVQIETALQAERHSSDGVFHAFLLPTLLRVGLGDRAELRFEGNTFTRIAGSNGFSPESVGAKLALLAPEQGPSLGIIARGFFASGSGDVKTSHFQPDVRLAADVPLNDEWSLNPNAGAGRYEADDGLVYGTGLFALTLNYNPTPRLNPFVDVGIQSSTGRGTRAAVTVDAGMAWIIGDNMQIDASVGQGLSGDVPRPFVAVGFSLRTGRMTQRRGAPARRRQPASPQ